MVQATRKYKGMMLYHSVGVHEPTPASSGRHSQLCVSCASGTGVSDHLSGCLNTVDIASITYNIKTVSNAAFKFILEINLFSTTVCTALWEMIVRTAHLKESRD